VLQILRIRFVLTPFSFLFLLHGNKKYHIVWETLNSEEATYIWHFEKSNGCSQTRIERDRNDTATNKNYYSMVGVLTGHSGDMKMHS
jgi:hypothetical protein